jgi:hypothetical protein
MAKLFQENTPAHFVQQLSKMGSYTFAHMIENAKKGCNLSWSLFYKQNRPLIREMQINIKLMNDQSETDPGLTKAIKMIPRNLLKNNSNDTSQPDSQDLSNYRFG